MDLGLTIIELAEKAGLTKGTIHNIFNTGDARLSQLEAIGKVLGVSVNALMGIKDVQAVDSDYTVMKKDDLLKLYQQANSNLEAENAKLKNNQMVSEY